MNGSTKISLLLMVSCLTACTNHAPAPVDDLRYSQKYKKSQKNKNFHKNISHSLNNSQYQDKLNKLYQHKVLPGETLFAIAWRYSLDYHSIAELNGLKAFRIYPGQNLILRKDKNRTVFNAPSLVAAINSDFLNKKQSQSYLKQQQKTNQKKPKVTTRKKPKLSYSTKKVKRPKQQRSRTSDNKIENWIWPVNGKVVRGFSLKSNQNKGLDIKAKKGSAVRATAPGKVVYSGNGLKGYGQLVIIKHNDSYLSAYAHNNKIHVLENEEVKAGQRIADLGKSGADNFKLHFEIRYKGKPVNPLNYLPKAG